MDNIIEFMRMFFSYVLCFGAFVLVAGLGIFIGIKWRKSKDAKEAVLDAQKDEGEQTQKVS